ncbi:hypothetical protein DSO57_1001919 [Entomophthora muscae]|uniref:Uncharacterized protein n=1 Tax=Entomophthora muscae TaxID=34485 RepID=A0ACC2UIK8_9FUNG|nr:hypothetical protein DSO57_1001919 [Entomophthora muscae]
MWQKLFGTRPNATADSKEADSALIERSAVELLEPNKWSPPSLQPSQLRLILCQDSGVKNKTPLYDSDQEKEPVVPNETRSGMRPPLRRGNLGSIGDMMFGMVPMSFKGTTTKLHPFSKDSKPQLLLTVLFSISQNELTEMDESELRGQPIMGMPKPADVLEISPSSQSSASGFLDDESSSMAASLASSLSSFHNVHLDRRLKKAGLTSLENGRFHPSTLPGRGSHEDLGSIKPKSASRMYALGLLITLGEADRHLRDFVYTHYSLLESRLHKLYAVAREAILESRGSARSCTGQSAPLFASYHLQSDAKLSNAVTQFQMDLVNLYLTPRIQEPLWLNMLSFPKKRPQYANSFIIELASLVSTCDNKATQYFISTLLTSVLSHHLSWVPVVPADFYKSETAKAPLSYNPLWAQLSDLYGNVGGVSRLSRTVMVGSNGALVRRILFILSYFIRCNDVVLTAQKYRFEDISQHILQAADVPQSEDVKEIPLISPQEMHIFPPEDCSQDNLANVNFLYTKSYGRSLMTGYHDKYFPGFVLQGVPRFDFIEELEGDLSDAIKFPVDEPVKEAVCVVADCNTWQCNVVKCGSTRSPAPQPLSIDGRSFCSTPSPSLETPVTRTKASQHIIESLDEVCSLFEVGLPAEACLQYLEDRLRQLHYKSLLLSSVLREKVGFGTDKQSHGTWNSNNLSQILSVHESDLPIIVAITSTYDPIARDLMLPTM